MISEYFDHTRAHIQKFLTRNHRQYKIFPFLRWWPSVTRATLRHDIIAGLVGAAIVLPQGVAFATIAGLPPQYGLYAAIVPAIIAALWGSSRHLVSGPTTAISIVVFSSISILAEPGTSEYIRLVLTLTFLVGVFQLAMGIARLGVLVNFISHTVVIGFTAGAAILIAGSQIKNFFGIPVERGASFYEIIFAFFTRLSEVHIYVLLVGIITLLSGIATKRFFPRFPYMISAMVVGSGAGFAFNYLLGESMTGIATIGTLPAHLPPLSYPDFSLGAIAATASSAVAVTILALTEAVSIGRAVAVRSGQRINGNQEFIGQGLSNLAGSFFSGYASSGSFNRSGLNYEAGAKTPLASVFAAIFLIVILFAVAPLAAYLPLATMAAILFLVAYGLIDFSYIRSILRTSRSETIILAATFFATLFSELEFAIYVGVLMSVLFYLRKTTSPAVYTMIPDPSDTTRKFIPNTTGLPECAQLKVVAIDGSLFFGATNHVERELARFDETDRRAKHILVVGKSINFIDVAAAEMLAKEARRRNALGGGLYFSGLREPIVKLLRRGRYMKNIGEDHIFPTKSAAIAAIHKKLNRSLCENGSFDECGVNNIPTSDMIK